VTKRGKKQRNLPEKSESTSSARRKPIPLAYVAGRPQSANHHPFWGKEEGARKEREKCNIGSEAQ